MGRGGIDDRLVMEAHEEECGDNDDDARGFSGGVVKRWLGWWLEGW